MRYFTGFNYICFDAYCHPPSAFRPPRPSHGGLPPAARGLAEGAEGARGGGRRVTNVSSYSGLYSLVVCALISSSVYHARRSSWFAKTLIWSRLWREFRFDVWP